MKVLLPIDIQQGFEDHTYWGGERNNPQFEANVEALITAARRASVPIIHVKHDSVDPRSPLRPGLAGNAIMACAAPEGDEPVLGKSVNSGFIGTDLEERLRALGATQLIAFGMTTDHCVSTTVRMAANLGFATVLVSDACATFPKSVGEHSFDAQTLHLVHLASLADEFADVRTTRETLASLQ
ncbi:MAG: cysteine hydrolase family protein [Pseudomonadota bacterium]